MTTIEEQRKKDAHAAYMRQYYETHPDKREEKRRLDREYAANHRQEALERATNYYFQNQDAVKTKQARRNYDLKIKALKYLGGIFYRCASCGENHPAVLQFHHRDPEEKLFSVTVKILGTPKRFPWDMITAELDKCDILCGNCHAKHHSAWDHETWSTECTLQRV